MGAIESFLIDAHPDIAKQYDTSKNSKDIATISSHSKIKYWWICSNSHSWIDSPKARVKYGGGCPICSGRRLLTGVNDVMTLCPELALDYAPTNTKDLSEVTCASTYNALWICHVCGKQWTAPISRRAKQKHGCPSCSRNIDSRIKKMIAKGEVCEHGLAETNPELVREWDYSKNEYGPEHYHAKSSQKVWWLCPQCHGSYEATISHRTADKSGCPYCSNYKVKAGLNDLATLAPKGLLDEWDKERNDKPPSAYVAHSKTVVHWICSLGHQYSKSIDKRQQGEGCPICAGKRVLSGFNDLQFKRPDIASQWNYSRNSKGPDEYTVASTAKVWWLGACGHEWEARICERTTRNAGCPICHKQYKTSFPEQAILFYCTQIYPDAIGRKIIDGYEFDIYIPSKDLAIEYDGVYWHKDKSSKEEKKDEFALKKGIRLVRIREPGLPTTEKAKCIMLEDFSLGCLQKAIEELLPSITANIDEDRSRIISEYIHAQKANSLAIRYPELSEEWDIEGNNGLTPEMFSPGSEYKASWICSKCGHHWKSTIVNRTNSGNGCPECKRASAGAKLQSFAAKKNPIPQECLSDWDYEHNTILPTERGAGSRTVVYWVCPKGHSYLQAINAHLNGKGKCPICSSHRIIQGINDLATVAPHLLAEWDYEGNAANGLTPNNVSLHSGKRVSWICNKGHHWIAAISSRTDSKNPHGCPYCAGKKVLTGFNDLLTVAPEAEAYWDYAANSTISPDQVSAGSHKSVFWKCHKGHSFQKPVRDMIKGNCQCPLCSRE